MHLPVIWGRRHLLREVSMLDKTSCVGIAFHAVIFDKLYGFFGRFGERVLCIRCDSDDRTV